MLNPFALLPSQRTSPYRPQSPRLIPIRTGSPAIGRDRSGTFGRRSPAQLSPLERGSGDTQRMAHESASRSGSPSPRPGHLHQMSVPSTSVPQLSKQGSSQVHNRSSSMNAGSTPLRSGKALSPLSTTLSLGDGLTAQPRLRKQPSAASTLSSNRNSFKAYDPSEALDPAYLASSSAEYGPSPTYAQHRSRSGRS